MADLAAGPVTLDRPISGLAALNLTDTSTGAEVTIPVDSVRLDVLDALAGQPGLPVTGTWSTRVQLGAGSLSVVPYGDAYQAVATGTYVVHEDLTHAAEVFLIRYRGSYV